MVGSLLVSVDHDVLMQMDERRMATAYDHVDYHDQKFWLVKSTVISPNGTPTNILTISQRGL